MYGLKKRPGFQFRVCRLFFETVVSTVVSELSCCVVADAAACEDYSDLSSYLEDYSSCWFQDDSYEGSQSSPMSLVAGTSDYAPLDDVFSPVSAASESSSSFDTLTPSVIQCQPQIPVPPDISPLLRSSRTSTEDQTVSRVPTPPDITPLLQGALSSANIQLPLASAQPSCVSALCHH